MGVLLLLAACAHVNVRAPAAAASDAPTGAPPQSVGAPAPGTVLVLDEAGLAALLSNPGDARLVVNFWATWCGPCVREMATMRTVAAENPSVRFALVSVDDPAGLPLVAPFLRSHDIDLPAYQLGVRDASGVLARHVPEWPDLIPVTLILDPGGSVRTRFDGAVEAASLRAALSPL